ncbi:extracellular solute-binding protein [Vibrio sp. DNB22_10_4]
MTKWLTSLLMFASLTATATATATATNERTKIDIMVPPAGDYISFFNEIAIPEFNHRYPNVEVVVSNDMNIDTRIAAGDTPNLYAGVFGYQPAKLAKLGLLVSYQSFDDFKQLESKIAPNFLVKNFGRNFYVPWNATTQLMIYNKELFVEAGLDPDSPPTTWDEYIEASQAISQLPRRKDGTPVYGSVMWNEQLSAGNWYWGMLAQLYYNFNSGDYGLLNKYGTSIEFDKQGANFELFLTMMKDVQANSPVTMEKNFFSRSIGMWPQYGFGWKNLLDSAAGRPMVVGEDVALAPIPTFKEGEPSYSTLDGRALMIFKGTRMQEDYSWKMVQMLMEDDMNHKANMYLGQLPVLTTLVDKPYYQSPGVKPFVEQLNTTKISEPFLQAGDVAGVILDTYTKVVLNNQMTPEQGLESAVRNANQVLGKGKN